MSRTTIWRCSYTSLPRLMLTIAIMTFMVSPKAMAQTETQSQSPNWKSGITLTGSGSVGQNEQGLTFAGLYNWRIALKNRFKIGLGLRSSSYWGQNQYFETAPARLTTNQTGPQVLFVATVPENIDTVKVGNAYTQSINAYLNLEYAITPKWDVGFNIDLAGFSFGQVQDLTLISSYQPNASAVMVTAKPTFGNVLLISDNDIGSLNSEFFVRYHLNDQLAIVGGASFLFSEITTDKKLPPLEDNDRFRRKAFMGTIGVTWYPFR